MKITIKKKDEVILQRDDVVSITDKFGAYEIIYEDEIGQYIYKADDVSIKIN